MLDAEPQIAAEERCVESSGKNLPVTMPEDARGISEIPENQNEEVLEAGHNFDLDRFQVVRREFFAHLKEPSISFSNYKISVNSACLSRFPKTDYVQVLVNRESKIMALLPCEEGERDSFVWCSMRRGKRYPKQITCRLFCAKIFSMMDWNLNNRYKLLGKVIHANGMYLIAFDLNSTEVYERIVKDNCDQMKMSRKPAFPEEWKNQFGLTYSEHKKSLKVDVFEGYAVYSITESKRSETNRTSSVTKPE